MTKHICIYFIGISQLYYRIDSVGRDGVGRNIGVRRDLLQWCHSEC